MAMRQTERRVMSAPLHPAPLHPTWSRRRRRGLAPLELVLWLPVLLMVMALIVNYANMTSWRLRGEVVARDAVWRSRWPRAGRVEPRPPSRVWPADAGMGLRGDDPMWMLDQPHIDHPVVRGPVLELGDPPRQFRVNPVLDPQVGAVRGTSDISRRFDLLPALGRYRSGEIAARMLTRQWQCAQMGFANHHRRSLVLYEMPRTPPHLPEAYVRSVVDLLGIPHYDAISVLERDQDWWLYHGSYPNFYPRIAADYCETDPAVVYERSVVPMIDRIDEDGEVVLGRISRLPRRMTRAYLRMYEATRQEIAELEEELAGLPPPTEARRLAILSRLTRLRQIQNLDVKIEQLERDTGTLDRREDEMKSYVLSTRGGSL